jgi:hypothetical protein
MNYFDNLLEEEEKILALLKNKLEKEQLILDSLIEECKKNPLEFAEQVVKEKIKVASIRQDYENEIKVLNNIQKENSAKAFKEEATKENKSFEEEALNNSKAVQDETTNLDFDDTTTSLPPEQTIEKRPQYIYFTNNFILDIHDYESFTNKFTELFQSLNNNKYSKDKKISKLIKIFCFVNKKGEDLITKCITLAQEKNLMVATHFNELKQEYDDFKAEFNVIYEELIKEKEMFDLRTSSKEENFNFQTKRFLNKTGIIAFYIIFGALSTFYTILIIAAIINPSIYVCLLIFLISIFEFSLFVLLGNIIMAKYYSAQRRIRNLQICLRFGIIALSLTTLPIFIAIVSSSLDENDSSFGYSLSNFVGLFVMAFSIIQSKLTQRSKDKHYKFNIFLFRKTSINEFSLLEIKYEFKPYTSKLKVFIVSRDEKIKIPFIYGFPIILDIEKGIEFQVRLLESMTDLRYIFEVFPKTDFAKNPSGQNKFSKESFKKEKTKKEFSFDSVNNHDEDDEDDEEFFGEPFDDAFDDYLADIEDAKFRK